MLTIEQITKDILEDTGFEHPYEQNVYDTAKCIAEQTPKTNIEIYEMYIRYKNRCKMIYYL